MKKNLSLISLFAVAIAFSLATIACSKDGNDNNSNAANQTAFIPRPDSLMPNYRYVDLDTVLSNYNLAKDYNQEIIRMQNNFESQVKQYQNKIQSLGTKIENKRQSNLYLTQESFDADMQEYATEQNKAQNAIAALQADMEKKAFAVQKTLNDSIEAFIQEYNMNKGYDAIFIKSNILYLRPDLDITMEVIEGLNAKYNKVK